MTRLTDRENLLKVQVLSLGIGGLELERVEKLQVQLEDGSWLEYPAACAYDCRDRRWRA